MGQLNSTNKLTITSINNIASDLILNLNKSDMILLKDIEYCNKLASVISSLLHDNISNYNINDLYYKIYNNLDKYIDDSTKMCEHIAKYYISVQKWVPAINRLKTIVNDYDKTIFIEEALHRLVEIHYEIGLSSLMPRDTFSGSSRLQVCRFTRSITQM